MRKEFRVGLGIGGVLMAVLVVALVVKSHTHPKVAAIDNKTDTDTPSAPTDPTPTPPASTDTPTSPLPPSYRSPTPPPADTPKPEDDVFGKTADSNGAESKPPAATSTWDSVFLSGNVTSPAPTITPTVGNTRVAIGEHFGPPHSSPGVTPGNLPEKPITVETAGHSPDSTTAAQPRGSRTHVVAQGETFSSIAKSTYGSNRYYLLIEKANPNVVPERLRPGTKIILPEMPASSEHADHADRHVSRGGTAPAAAVDSAREYVIKANDSLYRISMHLYGSPNKVDAIYELNKDLIGPDRGRLKLGMTLRLPTAPTSGSR